MLRLVIRGPGRSSRTVAQHSVCLARFTSVRPENREVASYKPASHSRTMSSSLLHLEDSSIEQPHELSPLLRIPDPTAERVVIRKFLDTLHVANGSVIVSSTTDSVIVSSTDPADEWQEPWVNTISLSALEENTVERPESTFHSQSLQHETDAVHSSPIEAIKEHTTAMTYPASLETPQKQQETVTTDTVSRKPFKADKRQNRTARVISMRGRLIRATRSRNVDQAVHFFRQSLQEQLPVETWVLRDLFYFLAPLDPVYAYKVLSRYQYLSAGPLPPEMYVHMCQTLGRVTLAHAKPPTIAHTFKCLKRDLALLDVETYHHVCYPYLLISMVQQPLSFVGAEARKLYHFMKTNNYPLTTQVLEQLVGLSRYSRQEDLPFADLIEILSQEGM